MALPSPTAPALRSSSVSAKECLRILWGAAVFAVEPGPGTDAMPEYGAFAQLRALPSAIAECRPMLRLWLTQAPPTTRLYAAVLLGLFDAAEGRAALRTLRYSGTVIAVRCGTRTATRTVGEISALLGEQVGRLWTRVLAA
jgi:hypothetical protein